jgi:hypothetical protein
MENMVQTNEQLRLNLLDKCFRLGLPASSKDDINTLEMYLYIDSILEVDSFNFHVEHEIKKNKGIKSLFRKIFSIYKT